VDLFAQPRSFTHGLAVQEDAMRSTDKRKTDKRKTVPRDQLFSLADLAALGTGQVAYVRPMRSEEVRKLVPQARDILGGLDLFALLDADGTPIMIADSRDELTANAIENELTTVSVH
jgi:hypothetical protein